MKRQICLIIFLCFYALDMLAQNTISTAIDLGIKSAPFTYSNTLNTNNFTNNFTGLSTKDVFYKFTLTQPMDIIINHCGSELMDTYLYVLSSNGSILYENNDDLIERVCPNRFNSYLKIKNLPAGTYFVVSEGVVANGNITTNIEGSLSSPTPGESTTYPIYIYGSGFLYKDYDYTQQWIFSSIT